MTSTLVSPTIIAKFLVIDPFTEGKPNVDRNWTECFAQLVGTVLSLWDAAALDAAGQDGEVAPTFINLADASIKMVIRCSTLSIYVLS
jgi:CCR4-NOT transcriptional complex subunit CAF120